MDKQLPSVKDALHVTLLFGVAVFLYIFAALIGIFHGVAGVFLLSRLLYVDSLFKLVAILIVAGICLATAGAFGWMFYDQWKEYRKERHNRRVVEELELQDRMRRSEHQQRRGKRKPRASSPSGNRRPTQ